ncbi:hypothetical protein RAA17_07235 [Komagataeibacter rhaeticus]|nr:hypothetical protein [Komagataeibacter rhaeticus]
MNRRYVFSLSAGLLASSCMTVLVAVPLARAQQASTAMTGTPGFGRVGGATADPAAAGPVLASAAAV